MINDTFEYLISMTKFLDPKKTDDEGVMVKLNIDDSEEGEEHVYLYIENNDGEEYYSWNGADVESVLAEALKSLGGDCEKQKAQLENINSLGESLARSQRKVG